MAPCVYVARCRSGCVLVARARSGRRSTGRARGSGCPAASRLQPSEFVKVALVRRPGDDPRGAAGPWAAPAARDLVLAWVVTGVPVGLVLLQPDLGSALVLVAMAVGVVAVGRRAEAAVLAGGVVVVVGGAVAVASRRRCCQRLPARPAHGLPRPVRSTRRASATRPGRCASRSARAAGGQGLFEGRADPGRLHPVPADRLRLLGRGGGARASSGPPGSSCSSCSSSCDLLVVARAATRSGGWSRGRRRVVRACRRSRTSG